MSARSRHFGEYVPFREAGVVRKGPRVFEVTVIKAGLGNRKDRHYYSDDLLREAVARGRFKGLKMFVDHPTAVDEEMQPERSVRDYAGFYENERFVEGPNGKGGRVVADLRILKANKWLADTVGELIEIGRPDQIGISINGSGATTRDQITESGETLDVNRVTEFGALASADVVTEAGAGGGFQQLLESARGAVKEKGMMAMTKKAQLQKRLAEAAKKGDLDLIERLTAQLRECETGKKSKGMAESEAAGAEAGGAAAGAEAAAEAGTKKRPPVATKKRTPTAEDADTDVEDDEVDHEAETERALARAADGPEDDDEVDADADEDDDEDEDDLDESDDEADEPTREATAGVLRFGGKTTDPFHPKKKKQPRGMQDRAAGSFTKNAGKVKRKGQRFGEADRTAPDVARLLHENERLKQRNNRLAEALQSHQKASAIRKLLKESKLPPELHAGLAARLMDLPNVEAMQREIGWAAQLRESSIQGMREEFDGEFGFERVEGNAARFRESFSDEDGENEFVGVLREAGVPLKQRRS